MLFNKIITTILLLISISTAVLIRPVDSVYAQDSPTLAGSPWPTFRHDARNTGFSPMPGKYTGDKPWMFQTGKGIFSTPVIDDKGIIYVGSADHYFYALNPDGTLNWKYETGEIIDSAGALGRFDPAKGCAPITFISGDGKMYHFRTGEISSGERKIWQFEARLRPGISYNRWFEGNVAIGQDGTLYAGNTNFNYYAVNPDGTLKWTYETASNNWSQAAFSDDGMIYWGSLDTYIRGVKSDGKELWRTRTLGFIAASAAVGSDGTVYIGSFDSNLYALNGRTGEVKWKFPTNDHIYSSAALEQDRQGKTTAIYFGSTDGILYALRTDGSLLWKYDTGDVIRSSPAIGLDPEGKGSIIYFGCGDGKLYALNSSGSLRWAFDTNSNDRELIDRNDLNGSPALGRTGIYIGGEHGQVWYVPYDYCLHNDDVREKYDMSLPAVYTGLYYVTPGGNTRLAFPAELPASAMITLRLMVRQGGETVSAKICNSPIGCPSDALVVTLDPPVPLEVEHSADGRYIYIRPQNFLSPGQNYGLKVSGKYYTGGWRIGNLTLGGGETGKFQGAFRFRVPEKTASFPLNISSDRVTAMEWTRLAAPIPSMLPSLNQIGFDYMEWLIAPVLITPADAANRGKFILWAIGARKDGKGGIAPDPASDFTIPLNGRYQGSDFILENRSFPMAITGITIPFNLFEMRGSFNADGTVRYPAAYADTDTLSIPTFGPYLVIAGLANNWWQKMLVSGTYVTRPYEGTASHVPEGISVDEIKLNPPDEKGDSIITCKFKLVEGASYRLVEHRPGLVLVDNQKNEAIYMNYHANLKAEPDAAGNLHVVTLAIPKSVKLPRDIRVYVMLDAFPAYQATIQMPHGK